MYATQPVTPANGEDRADQPITIIDEERWLYDLS
jgi:hypothetical protein